VCQDHSPPTTSPRIDVELSSLGTRFRHRQPLIAACNQIGENRGQPHCHGISQSASDPGTDSGMEMTEAFEAPGGLPDGHSQ
jgi:hypothetical protein